MKNDYFGKKNRFIKIPSIICFSLIVTGCAGAGLQAASTAVGLVIQSTGLANKSKDPKDLKVKVFSRNTLNAADSGESLSLVLKIYLLKAKDRFASAPYDTFSQDQEKDYLSDDLISTREVIVLPEKTTEIELKVPPDAAAIGAVALFRKPAAERWKLVFDANKSFKEGISIGAHACALTTPTESAIPSKADQNLQSLVGVRCR